jgi:hypothetical protein
MVDTDPESSNGEDAREKSAWGGKSSTCLGETAESLRRRAGLGGVGVTDARRREVDDRFSRNDGEGGTSGDCLPLLMMIWTDLSWGYPLTWTERREDGVE